jgi:hypothetical protein
MRIARTLITAVLSCAGLGACVTSPGGDAARTQHAFEAREPRPADCDFEVFEEREPPRPYRVLGTLPFSSNAWMSEAARKEALRGTACGAGADAVLLPRPSVRKMNLGNRQAEELREYEARFVIWTDGSTPEAAESQQSPQAQEPGALVVPSGPEWPGETEGTSTRQAPASQR